jgi:hypothetical protein
MLMLPLLDGLDLNLEPLLDLAALFSLVMWWWCGDVLLLLWLGWPWPPAP